MGGGAAVAFHRGTAFADSRKQIALPFDALHGEECSNKAIGKHAGFTQTDSLLKLFGPEDARKVRETAA